MTKDLLCNKFSNDRNIDSRAMTIIDSNASSNVPSMVEMLTQSEADALTTLSTLSQSVNQASVGNKQKRHELEVCTEEV